MQIADPLLHIFCFSRHSAADMPLRFVQVQDIADPGGKAGVDLSETYGNVFMHGRFADPVFLRCLAHSCLLVDNVAGNFHCPFFYVILQRKASEDAVCTVYAEAGPAMRDRLAGLLVFVIFFYQTFMSFFFFVVVDPYKKICCVFIQ